LEALDRKPQARHKAALVIPLVVSAALIKPRHKLQTALVMPLARLAILQVRSAILQQAV
jgi:hypothetical protein